MKNNLKQEKGITLIALVITIVVLMILAGVSINTVLGDDGIIKKAKEAAETTKRASAEEEMNRLVLEYQLASKDETLESFLQEKVTEGRIDGVTDNGDGTITITKKVEGKDYTITVKKPAAPTPSVKVGAIRVVSDSTGAGSSLGEASTRKGTTLYIMIESTISGGTTTVSPEVPYAVTENGTYKFTVTGTVNGTTYTKEVSVTVNQFKNSILEDINIKIGDSVNYTYDSAGSYSLSSTYSGYSSNQTIAQTTGLTWKVLNVDKENDTVDIISTNPTSSTVYFYNILGYNNGPYLMNEICKAQYSNKTLGVNARSINLLDMEKQLTAAGIKSRNEYNKGSSTYAQYGTTKTYTSNTKYPSLYANQKGAGPNVSSITPSDTTKGNDPYEESKPIATTEPTTDSTYGTENPLTVTQTYYNIPINEPNYGDAGSVLSNSTWYWVASRYVATDSDYAGFGLRNAGTCTDARIMFGSDGYTGDNFNSLRPVVSLSSSILSETKDASEAWMEFFKEKGYFAVKVDARNKGCMKAISAVIAEACKEKTERDRKRGIKNRPVRAMVVGIPNVGKSTFINTFAGRACAKTGNKPGVTKGKQWIRLNKSVELLDTPGILWPKFEDQQVGLRLALIGAIKDEILNIDELALELIAILTEHYPGVLHTRYEVEEEQTPANIIEQIAVKRNCIQKGNELDYTKAANLLLDEFRSGKLGKITLEFPVAVA